MTKGRCFLLVRSLSATIRNAQDFDDGCLESASMHLGEAVLFHLGCASQVFLPYGCLQLQIE